ncbi:MAG: hypothetical protein H0W24_10325 [Lysobacter sp.]|nr:hypothetical protein [Lysobacter sp.]MDQ3269220.1 hypothetical protein [Pseudomonadota bacterium]
MKSRRALLMGLGLGLPGLAVAAATNTGAAPAAPKAAARRAGGVHAARFPTVAVTDQTGKQFGNFYDDLVRDKLVLISFASIDGEKRYPIVDNLVKVQQMVRDRLGKDLFMYTVNTRPDKDSVADLKAFADSKGARWQFLTGETAAIDEIKQSLRVMGNIHGLVWMSNDKSGRILSKPARLQPLYLTEALAFLSTGSQHKQFLTDMRSWKS